MLTARERLEIRTRLHGALGERLRSIVLYGSEARGQARPDSDVDMLVVLADAVQLAADVEAIIRALYPLQRRMPDRPLHVLPVSEEDYLTGNCGLYRIARAEGIAV